MMFTYIDLDRKVRREVYCFCPVCKGGKPTKGVKHYKLFKDGKCDEAYYLTIDEWAKEIYLERKY